jgi:large subunit ribosomal protein L18
MFMKIRRIRRARSLTDYKKRVALLKGRLPRVVVRKSNRSVTAQLVAYEPDGDKVIASAHSRELAQLGWPPRGNIPTAYLTGMLLAKKQKANGVGRVVLDTGISKPVKSNVLFAAAKGCADGGLELINSIEFDPARLAGKHISAYAASAAGQGSVFSKYRSAGIDPAKIDVLFEEVKKKILSK